MIHALMSYYLKDADVLVVNETVKVINKRFVTTCLRPVCFVSLVQLFVLLECTS